MTIVVSMKHDASGSSPALVQGAQNLVFYKSYLILRPMWDEDGNLMSDKNRPAIEVVIYARLIACCPNYAGEAVIIEASIPGAGKSHQCGDRDSVTLHTCRGVYIMI